MFVRALRHATTRLLFAALVVVLSTFAHAETSSEMNKWISEVMSKVGMNLHVNEKTPDGEPIWGTKVAIVSVVMDPDGNVLNAEVAQGSGFDYLDQSAIRAIKRSSPLPPFPGEIDEDGKTIMMPIKMVFRDKPVS